MFGIRHSGHQCFGLHPFQITPGLIRRHDSRHLVQMLEHGCLAIRPECRCFGQRLSDFRCYDIGGHEQALKLIVFFVNSPAHFHAFRLILQMQLANPCHLGIAELVFVLHPSQRE